MMDILRLSKCEFAKIMKTGMAKVLLVILSVIMIGITVSEYNQHQADQDPAVQAAEEAFDSRWQERENFLLSESQSYMEDPYYSDIQKEAIRKRLEIAEYKLEHNISRNIYKNTWYFFSDSMFKWVSIIVSLFAALIAAFSVASEYNDRTITQILLLPYKRSKILTAKYMASFMYAAICLGIVIVLGILSGAIVYGFSLSNDSIILSGVNGPYLMSGFTYSITVVLMKLLEIALMIFLAIMIAILSKSTALATILTALTLIIVKPFSLFASAYNDLWQYTPFLNSDLRKYLEFGSVMPGIENGFNNNVIAGMSWQISLAIVIAYCAVFAFIAYGSFCKQDTK